MVFKIGQPTRHHRTFSLEDAREFVRVSRITNSFYTALNQKGQLIVHPILVSTIGTKMGADLNIWGGMMGFESLLPVYTGENIVCEFMLIAADQQEDDKGRRKVFIEGKTIVRNEQQQVVQLGKFSGVIFPDR